MSEDIVKNILAKIEEVDSSQIDIKKSSDVRKRGRKKKTKDIITDLELTGDHGPKICDWERMPSRKVIQQKLDIDKWSNRDLVYYVMDLYSKKFYNTKFDQWDFGIPGCCLEINKIHDLLQDTFGMAPILMVKDYITYFFNYHIDRLVKRYGYFYFTHLKNAEAIEYFYHHYDYKESLKKYKTQKEKKIETDHLSNEDIEKSYELSVERLLVNYGIIISVNWLIMKKNLNYKQAIQKTINGCQKIYNRRLFDTIKLSTEKWSPYPEWFIFTQIKSVLNIVDSSLKIKIQFNSSPMVNNKFDFFRKDGNVALSSK